MEQKERVTVKDIASRLQISPGTVSKALSGKKGISASMRCRICDTAAEMGYHVNRTAQSLARKTIRIGIAYPAVWAQYYDQLIRGMNRALDSLRDYNVIGLFHTFSGLYETQELSAIVEVFIRGKIDAVILCPGAITDCDTLLQQLREAEIPCFLVGNDFDPSLRTACIRVDAVLAGKLAGEMMNYLTPENAQLLAFIGDGNLTEHAEKLQGFRTELQGGRYLAGCFETQDNPVIAAEMIQKAVCDFPQIRGVYVATGNSVPVCEILSRQVETAQVRIIATDLFPELVPYVCRRQIHAVVFQNPEAQGEQAVLRCYEHITKHEMVGQCLITPSVLLRNSILAMQQAQPANRTSSEDNRKQ